MKWRHTEEQIIGFLLEADAGLPKRNCAGSMASASRATTPERPRSAA